MPASEHCRISRQIVLEERVWHGRRLDNCPLFSQESAFRLLIHPDRLIPRVVSNSNKNNGNSQPSPGEGSGAYSGQGKTRWLIYILLSVLIFGVYHQVLSHTYGHTDDYPGLAYTDDWESLGWSNTYAIMGRPVLALFILLGYGSCLWVEDLAGMRFFGLVCLLINAITCLVVTQRAGLSKGWALFLALLISFNPYSGVVAGWAIAYSFPISSAFSLLAADLLLKKTIHHAVMRWLVALLCIVLAFSIYQPTAFFFFVPLIIHYQRALKHAAIRPTDLVEKYVIFGIGILTYYVAYKGYLHFSTDENNFASRGAFTKDLSANVQFYFQEVLPDVLKSWSSLLGPAWQWCLVGALCGICLAGLPWKRFRDSWLQTGYYLLSIIAAVFLSSLFYLALEEKNAFYRTQASLLAIYFTLVTLSLAELQKLKVKLVRHILPWVALFIVSFHLICSYYFVTFGIVRIHSEEYANYESHLKVNLDPADLKPHSVVYTIHPVANEKQSVSVRSKHEYGTFSSWLPWVPQPMLTILLNRHFHEQRPENGKYHWRDVVQVYPWQERVIPPGSIVIDGSLVLSGKPSPQGPNPELRRHFPAPFFPGRSDHPLFGEIENLNFNFFFLPGIGFCKDLGDGRLRLLGIGVFDLVGTNSSKNQLTLAHDSEGVFQIDKDRFPVATREGGERVNLYELFQKRGD